MHAEEMGRRGGRARAKKMTGEQRTASARKAAVARWSKNGIQKRTQKRKAATVPGEK